MGCRLFPELNYFSSVYDFLTNILRNRHLCSDELISPSNIPNVNAIDN